MSEPTYTKTEIEKALFQGYKDWCAARGHHELMCDPVTDELPFIMAALQKTEKEPDHPVPTGQKLFSMLKAAREKSEIRCFTCGSCMLSFGWREARGREILDGKCWIIVATCGACGLQWTSKGQEPKRCL